MFNDKYGLTQAVLEGRKTMTRRMANAWERQDGTLSGWMPGAYKVGEEVAVAQPYKDIVNNKFFINQCFANEKFPETMLYEAGWNNKMFTASYYMPHRIRINNIKVERLQDISAEDCIREGVLKNGGWRPYNFALYGFSEWFETPQKAFSVLIDKVSGKGTWESNPWVFAYEFELLNS